MQNSAGYALERLFAFASQLLPDPLPKKILNIAIGPDDSLKTKGEKDPDALDPDGLLKIKELLAFRGLSGLVIENI